MLVTALVLFLLAVNAAPMLVMRLLTHLVERFSSQKAEKSCLLWLFWPVDQYRQLSDRERLFGQCKTCLGVFMALVAGAFVAPLFGWSVGVGILLALAAMLGDLCSSFIKRRQHLVPGAKVTGLDQLPEVLLPASLALWLLPLNIWQFLVVVFGFIGGHILLTEIIAWFKQNPTGQELRNWVNNPRLWLNWRRHRN